jgi:penicillin-insensitive murein DD-endopeptidase
VFFFGCGLAGLALAKGPTPWQTVKTPAPGPAQSIGEYSGGCVQGALALPPQGEGYQVARPKRLRHFGHPLLVDFVQTLGREVRAAKLEPLRVGDLSQPRGGRAPGAHASHQTGLDADLWYASVPSGSIVDAKGQRIQKKLAPRVRTLLRLAASDARVSRVFVNPLIKRDLCASAGSERAWLEKIRPWYGHDAHFHVRLLCPADSGACQGQEPIPPGDGCGDDLDWWLSDKYAADRAEARKKYQGNVASEAPAPPQCDALIAPQGGSR